MSGPKSNTTTTTNCDSSDDEQHYVNKENATPIALDNTKPASMATTEVRLRIGGVPFVLDQETLRKFNSEYLTKMIASTATTITDTTGSRAAKSPPSVQHQQQQQQQQQQLSPRRAPNNNEETLVTIIDDADGECFSALVHMVRFGTLPTSIFSYEKREQLLYQAGAIWGLRDKVEAALENARAEFRYSCDYLNAIQRCILSYPMSTIMTRMPPGTMYVPSPDPHYPQMCVAASSAGSSYSSYVSSVPSGETALCLGGPHHNFRRDDGSRRVFCSSCGHRDIDWRYNVGDYYSNCMKCNKEICYKPLLGWCHKCRMCTECQTSECPGVPIRQLEEQVIPYMMATLRDNENALAFF